MAELAILVYQNSDCGFFRKFPLLLFLHSCSLLNSFFVFMAGIKEGKDNTQLCPL